MTQRDKDAADKKKTELKEFVDKIANLFEALDLSSAEFLLPQKRGEHHPHISGYLLRELSSFKMADARVRSKKEREFIKVIPEEEFKETLKKSLVSSASQAHRLTLKQDLHFDAFKKLLLERGLVVKKVMDWKIHNPGKEVMKIREWGKKYSSIHKNPTSMERVCIIVRKEEEAPKYPPEQPHKNFP